MDAFPSFRTRIHSLIASVGLHSQCHQRIVPHPSWHRLLTTHSAFFRTNMVPLPCSVVRLGRQFGRSMGDFHATAQPGRRSVPMAGWLCRQCEEIAKLTEINRLPHRVHPPQRIQQTGHLRHFVGQAGRERSRLPMDRERLCHTITLPTNQITGLTAQRHSQRHREPFITICLTLKD